MISQVADTSIEPGPLIADDAQEKPEGGKERSLGVLFVHGIGSQKRGDTLPSTGDPLYGWLRRWFSQGGASDSPEADNGAPHLTDTRLTRSIPSEVDAPPFSRLRFPQKPGGQPGERDEWMLAESWWASEFLPPTYSETLPLALVIAPWLIEQTGLRIITEMLNAIRARDEAYKLLYDPRKSVGDEERPKWSESAIATVGAIVGYFLWFVAQIVTRFLGWLILLILGLVAQLAMYALTILGLIPMLSGTAVRLQLGLAGWLGDAFVMAISPVRFDAMISQVRRDIQWLATEGGCKSIAVIAHSGGAIVAHAAVTGPEAPKVRCPILLVTYGSGQSKLDSMRRLNRERSPYYKVSPIIRAAGAGFLLAALLLGIQDPPPQFWFPVCLLVGIGLSVGWRWVGGRLLTDYDEKRPFNPPDPRCQEWIDYRALADIVPDDDIWTVVDDGNGKQARTEQSHNLHSIFKDHGWYWHNDEEFVAEIARLLHAKAYGLDLPGNNQDIARLEKAAIRRQDRVLRFLTAGLLLVVSAPFIWLELGPKLAERIGEPLRKFLLELFTLTHIDISTNALPDVPVLFWANVIGMVVVSGALVLWNKWFIFSAWSGWTRAEEEVMFKRDTNPNTGKWRGSAILFLLMSTVIPAVAFLVAALDTLVFNIGFPQGIGGVQLSLATLIGSVPGSDWAVDAVRSATFHEGLKWTLLVLSGLILLTSLVNARTAWKFHTRDPKPGRDRSILAEKIVFNRLLELVKKHANNPDPGCCRSKGEHKHEHATTVDIAGATERGAVG